MPLKTAKKGGSLEGEEQCLEKGKEGSIDFSGGAEAKGSVGVLFSLKGKREEARMADFYS